MADTKSTITESLELLPPEGNNKVGYRVFEVLGEILGDKAQLGLPTKWTRNYEMGKNKHWKTDATGKSLVSANLMFSHRMRSVNMLTDNNPTFNITKLGDPDESDGGVYEMYEKLLKAAQFWWIDQEQQNVLESSVHNGETYGITIEKLIFNPDLEYNLGEVETVVIDPYNFGWYPVKSKDPARKAEALLHFYPMTVREARRRWPNSASEIQADAEYLKELGDTRREVSGGRPGEPKGYFSTFGSIVKHIVNTFGLGKGKDDELLIVEAWVKDYTVDNKEPKYPGYIRCVTACNGGKIVLSDRANPSINPGLKREDALKTYLYDKFPFSITASVTDTANAWGMCDFEQLSALNIEIDKTLSQFTLVKDKASRIKFLNPKTSGILNSEITNAPGILNPNNELAAQALKYIDPPKIDPYLIKAIDIYKDFFFLVAGTFELEQAQTPGRDVIAYKAIAALLERASKMLKGKISNYDKMIRERGRMYLSHVQNWYTEDRWITYDEDGEENSMAIRGSELIVPAKLGVVSGTTMPVSKVQRREEAVGLFEKNAIDQEELLRILEVQDRKNIIKRMRAGVFGMFFERLAAIGAPEQLLAVFQELSQMDEKDFESSLEKGEIPPFADLVPPQEGGEAGPASPPPTPVEEAEIAKTDVDIEKTKAEIELILEQINTERVEQMVKMSGVDFDSEKLAIERAKAVSDIEAAKEDGVVKRAETANKITAEAKKKGTEPYQEKGMKSNNEKV